MGGQSHFLKYKDATEVAWIEVKTFIEHQFNKIDADALDPPDMYPSVTKKDALALWHRLEVKVHALEMEMIKLWWQLGKMEVGWDEFMKDMKSKDMREFVVASKEMKEGRDLLDDLEKQVGLYRKSAWENMHKIDFAG